MSKREFNYGGSAWSNTIPVPDPKKKKKSRWGSQNNDKTFIPGMPTVIPQDLSKEQEEQYLVHLQIEEISRRLRSGDLGIPPNPEDRSPSPEPIYNNEGKRLNTREYRTRKKLEEDRHNFVQKALVLNTDFKPPSDYKPPVIRVSDKVMIPQDDHPDINFVGLLIGPRGNTLKNLEKETGAKIIIRGKGSVKEGKVGRKDGQPLPGEDEPLHAYVTANNPEHVTKAVERVKQIIKEGIEVPEGQNDLRRQQLRELALLNGTLRENDGLAKLKQLAQAQTIVTNTIICTKCGGTGHIAQDCKLPKPGDTFRNMPVEAPADKAKMDSEYMSLMAELGEGPPPPKPNERSRLNMPPPGRQPFSAPPPVGQAWRSGPPPAITGGPSHHPNGLGGFSSQPPPFIRTTHPPPGLVTQTPTLSTPPQSMLSPPHQQAVLPPPGVVSHPLTLGSQPPTLGVQAPAVSVPNMPANSFGAGIGSHPPPGFNPQGIATQPPVSSTANVSSPPWQVQASQPAVSASSSQAVGGMVPPPMMAPPPPPPSSQPPMPWQQPQHPGMPAPWQQQPRGVAPVPPPPPSSMAPWQGPPPNSLAPPPPPPGQQNHFNAMAPPPPPPGSRGNMGIPGGIPLGVPPPPPPN